MSIKARNIPDSTLTAAPADMTRQQWKTWKRDVPSGCPCEYIWTGLVWTRSGSTPLCELHGGDAS